MANTTLTNKVTDTRPGSTGQYAAQLESKLAGIAGIGKLAAGNLFIGQYVGTRGTNGIVGFGRPFTRRPVALRGWAKYNCGKITDVGTTQPTGVTIAKGDPDNGIIYVALGTWTPEEYGICEKETDNKMLGTAEVPICVDTRDKNTFFNPKSAAVIAYGGAGLRQIGIRMAAVHDQSSPTTQRTGSRPISYWYAPPRATATTTSAAATARCGWTTSSWCTTNRRPGGHRRLPVPVRHQPKTRTAAPTTPQFCGNTAL